MCICVSSENCPETLDIKLSRSQEGTQDLSAQVCIYVCTYAKEWEYFLGFNSIANDQIVEIVRGYK